MNDELLKEPIEIEGVHMTEAEKISWRTNYYGNKHKAYEDNCERIYEKRQERINQYKIDNPDWKSNWTPHEVSSKDETNSADSPALGERFLFFPAPVEFLFDNKETKDEAWEATKLFSLMLKDPELERKELESDIEDYAFYNLGFTIHVPLTEEDSESLKIEKTKLLLKLKQERPDLYENSVCQETQE